MNEPQPQLDGSVILADGSQGWPQRGPDGVIYYGQTISDCPAADNQHLIGAADDH